MTYKIDAFLVNEMFFNEATEVLQLPLSVTNDEGKRQAAEVFYDGKSELTLCVGSGIQEKERKTLLEQFHGDSYFEKERMLFWSQVEEFAKEQPLPEIEIKEWAKESEEAVRCWFQANCPIKGTYMGFARLSSTEESELDSLSGRSTYFGFRKQLLTKIRTHSKLLLLVEFGE